MLILLYQLLIVATLGGVRLIAPKQLTAASLIWTALTIFNLFWPPLIALQLIVIWSAYAIFKPGESASKQKVQPSSPRAGSTSPSPVKAASAGSNTQAKSASAPAAMPGKSIFTPETIDPAVSVRPAPPAPKVGPLAMPPVLPGSVGARQMDTASVVLAAADSGDPVALAESEPPPAAVVADSTLPHTIEELAGALTVPMLAHFTRASNLESILKYGLCSLEKAAEIGIVPNINDERRLDGRRAGVSLSIGFPNHKMFFKYRQMNPEERWVVLGINCAVLWKKSCGFCQRNAADRRIRGLPLASLTGVAAFRGMFDQLDDLPSRAEQNLQAFDPTDPQAEVLVFDVIEPEYIEAIAFDSADLKNAFSVSLGDRYAEVFGTEAGPFASRGYYRKGRH